jgi:hemerythrin-like domain-containing protein
MNASAAPSRPSATREARAPRAARPPVAQPPGFEALDRAHLAAMDMLGALDRLITRLDDVGLDAGSSACAREILDFFNGPGAQHHAQEEQQVFPGLLVAGDPVLVAHVRRLQQDHGWLEEDWRELEPQVQAIAAGYNWYDLPMLRMALPIFTALYQEHIALEETLVYPAARALHAQLKAAAGERTATG